MLMDKQFLMNLANGCLGIAWRYRRLQINASQIIQTRAPNSDPTFTIIFLNLVNSKTDEKFFHQKNENFSENY